MSVISLYHWDYDHRRPSNEPFHTFSIAIFQWQPKASGKGLKKVNASRVCGYAADPNTIYVKAQEICDRLNREAANVLHQPTWLQKQYSVPRPKWIAPDPPREHLDLSVVRSIRQAVMKRLLLPAGFVKATDATYARKQNDQIHLVYFQGIGGQYRVNLGFHYAFLKPFFARKRIPICEYHILDCAFQGDLNSFLATLRRQFDYGTDRGLLRELFEANVVDSLNVFTKYAKKWADPKQWLKYAGGSSVNRRVHEKWFAPEFNEFVKTLAQHLEAR